MVAAPLAELYEEKAAAYAAFGNGVVAERALSLLPAGGRVLDIGCASGGLLALLRERASYTAGIDVAEAAVAEARKVADLAVCAPIEDPTLPFKPGEFDVVVLADVLEHLVEPEAALSRALSWLKPGGSVIVSVPNIAHWQARLVVLRGQWRSEQSGTWDAGHLRFFTVSRLWDLLRGAGLEVVEVRPVVPRLANHNALLGRSVLAERAWQRLGRARPNLLGYQLVGTGRR